MAGSLDERTADDPMRGVLGIVRVDGRVLMIQRSAQVRAPLTWCFPGGEIEVGETQAAALVREMREEVDLAVAPGELLMTQTKHDGRLVLYCWSARVLGGAPRPNPREVAAVAWLRPAEVRRMAGLLPGTVEILEGIGA